METLLYFLLWAGLFFLMMRLGCGSHVMGHGHHGGGSSTGHRHPEGGGGGAGSTPETAVDPVCGMTVKTAEAKTAVHQGQAYYFCSPVCRDKFEASPASYLKGAAAAPAPMEHRHGIAQ